MSAETAAFRRATQAAHDAMFQELRDTLRSEHDSLTADTADFRVHVQTSHRAMADALGEKLTTDRATLAADTTKLREGISALLGEIHTDNVGAAMAWRSISSLLSDENIPSASEPVVEKKQPTASAAVSPMPRAVHTAAEVHSAPVVSLPDDLTAIHGIGPSSRKKFDAAGITSFAQLAEIDRDELSAIVGPTVTRLSNLDEWIEQAKQLFRKE
jgi:predicted flap endonuclease-1-like 5' DNA nuclease